MLRIIIRAIFCTVFAVASASISVSVAQQPPAPIPSQIISGKTVFVSNASGENASANADPNLAYNEFYAALKSWGHYDLVAAPGDADLIFEIRYIIALGLVNVQDGNGGSAIDPEFILVIRDPKTHVLLWSFNESVHKEKKQTGRQAFDQALAKIVDDVKKLAIQPVTTANTPNK
jgi:hypothetical protein